MSGIVVGVDGSPESRRALRWAVAEARLRGAALKVVHAWTLPHLGAGQELATEVIAAVGREAEDLVENEVDELGEDAAGIEVTCAAVEGAPAAALLDAATGADLLVVGSRGRGGFTSLLLGSVSQQVAQHAGCPVVIVPPERAS